ncbi:MAG: FISUMP domain-containing protein [Muribaculaceae bacterium]
MKKINIYINLFVALLILLTNSSCNNDEQVPEIGMGKPTLHITFGNSDNIAKSTSNTCTDIQIFPDATVTTYNLNTNESVTTKYDANCNIINQQRSSKSISRASVTADAQGTSPDELKYNRVEIYYFAEKDNDCFYKQVLTTSGNFGQNNGLLINIPENAILKQFSDNKYSRARVLVIVNCNTSSVNIDGEITETTPGTIFNKLMNFKQADMVSNTTIKYPDVADASATANNLMIYTSERGGIDFSQGKTYNMQLQRMAAKIMVTLTGITDISPYSFKIINTTPVAHIFSNTISSIKPVDYLKNELVNTPWIGADVDNIKPNTMDISGTSYIYTYTNENLQAGLNNDTRTTLLIRKKSPSGAYSYYRTYICPNDMATEYRDGHIRRNFIYDVKVSIDNAGNGGESDESAKEIESTLVTMWGAGNNTVISPNQITVVEYYEKFYINQGYYFADIFYKGIKAGDASTYLEYGIYTEGGSDFETYSQDLNNTYSNNYDPYTVVGSKKLNDPTYNVPFGNGKRIRVDMKIKTGYGSQSKFNNPPRWNVGDVNNQDHAATMFSVKVGTKTVKKASIEFEKKDIYHNVKIGNKVWMKHNLGAWVPPYLYFPNSCGDSYQWGRKTPSFAADDDVAQKSINGPVNYTNIPAYTTIPGRIDWYINMASTKLLWTSQLNENNPCPPGYTVPKVTDFKTIIPATLSWSPESSQYNDYWGKYCSMTTNGFSYKFYTETDRNFQYISDGERIITFADNGYYGTSRFKNNAHYWTSDYDTDPNSWCWGLSFNSLPNKESGYRSTLAISVRCIKE